MVYDRCSMCSRALHCLQLIFGKALTQQFGSLGCRCSHDIVSCSPGVKQVGLWTNKTFLKGLISSMIGKLEKEASADATKKAYCDKETADATASKNDKAATVEKLSVKIDKMNARSATLKEEVATLQKELAALAATQVEMDKVQRYTLPSPFPSVRASPSKYCS